jgi:hypothetical protein
VCALRFAPLRARGDTYAELRRGACGVVWCSRVARAACVGSRRRVTADARRTRVLERLGYRVRRLDAELVLRELPVALEAVREALQAFAARGGS